MTAEPDSIPQPGHPLYALTTFELRAYRDDLEHAFTAPPGHAERRKRLQDKLAEVLAEQESRAKSSDMDAVIGYITSHP